MEVMAPPIINALNGSSVKLSCTFNSCYKVENKQFSLNWTYQECSNCSEELVSLAGDVLGAWEQLRGCSWGFLACREGVPGWEMTMGCCLTLCPHGCPVPAVPHQDHEQAAGSLREPRGVHRQPRQVRRVLHPQERAAGGRGHLQLLRAEPPGPAPGPRQDQPEGAHPRAPQARLDSGRDRGRLRGRLPGRGDPGADGGEMRAPEKAAEAQHGRPEDGGGREDGW
uniref:Uncharacterized protein n=1 Tax=Junco hyemalis TaxID=40217 RepID=A0A8C5I7R5_JUNHY